MITQRILSLLEEKSLTATDLCRAIGINTSTMTNWKNRGTDPPAKMIIPICEFLGVSSDYLLTGKKRNSNQSVPSEDSEWLALIHQLPHESAEALIIAVAAMIEENNKALLSDLSM